MPSDAAKAKRKVKRDQQRTTKSTQSQPSPTDEHITVDGKQVKAVNPQMQKTAHQGHGEQSERGHCSELQETPHVRLVINSGKLATKLLQPIPTRVHRTAQHANGQYQGPKRTSIPSGYSTRSKREVYQRPRLDVAAKRPGWRRRDAPRDAQVIMMHIVPDEQYEPEFITLFHNTVQQKAARIAESKRRRYARAHRQPQNNSCIHP